MRRRFANPRRKYRRQTMRSQPIALLFDVNRTILVEDKAAGKDAKQELVTVLASTVLGKVTKSTPPVWEKVPQETADQENGLMSYYTFVQEILYPFPAFPDSLSTEERKKKIDDIKSERRELLKHFTEKGNPGHFLSEELHTLLKKIEYPPPFSLLTSFYKSITHLVQNRKILTSLVFRTFGTDLDTIPTEWNAFCEGKHPSFPSFKMNGENSSRDMRLTQSQLGCFFRKGPSSDDCYLIMGTIEQPDFTKKESIEIYNGKPVQIFHGFQQIDSFLQEKYKKGTVLALRDYYPWWAANSEKFNSGKLLFLDTNSVCYSPPSGRIHQIFFDDNFHYNEFSQKKQFICDVRSTGNGKSIDPRVLDQKLLFKANALEAIKSEDYFIDLVEKAEKNIIDGKLILTEDTLL